MPGFGSNAYLAICRQNSMGATAPSSWYNVPFANHGLDWNPEELQDDSISGNPDEPNRVLGYTRAAGPIVANVHPIVTGHLLRGLCGQSSPAAVGSGFIHTFNPKSGDFGISIPSRPTLSRSTRVIRPSTRRISIRIPSSTRWNFPWKQADTCGRLGESSGSKSPS